MVKDVELGPLESRLLFTLEEQQRKFFDFQQAKEILERSNSSVQNVLYRLRKKNRITELERGKYGLNPAKSGLEGHWVENAYLAVDFLLDEYYIGFWTALQYWGMTEQIPQVVQVATPKHKSPIRYGGQDINFITISDSRFFGHIRTSTRSVTPEVETFRVASREKALLDALTYPQHCGGLAEASKALWNARDEVDQKQFLRYLDELSVSAVQRRLGYLLSLLSIHPELQQELQQDFTGYRWLDPSASKNLHSYSHEWGLKLNLNENELLAWRES